MGLCKEQMIAERVHDRQNQGPPWGFFDVRSHARIGAGGQLGMQGPNIIHTDVDPSARAGIREVLAEVQSNRPASHLQIRRCTVAEAMEPVFVEAQPVQIEAAGQR